MDSKIKRQMQTDSSRMRFVRKTAKYTRRDHKTNEEILNELKVTFTKFIDKICTKRHKTSGQTTEVSWKNETGTGQRWPISLKVT
jgi:hypothetical protein